MNKRIYRSSSNKMVAGVCGGIGEYFDVDPTLVRLAFVLLVMGCGTGVLLYILGAIIIPVAPYYRPRTEEPTQTAQAAQTTEQNVSDEPVVMKKPISLDKTNRDENL